MIPQNKPEITSEETVPRKTARVQQNSLLHHTHRRAVWTVKYFPQKDRNQQLITRFKNVETSFEPSSKRVVLVCKKHFSGWAETILIIKTANNESMCTLVTTNLGSQNLKIESARIRMELAKTLIRRNWKTWPQAGNSGTAPQQAYYFKKLADLRN